MNVESFMERLSDISPAQKKKPVVSRRLIDKVFCNFKGNFGKYQVLPFNSTVTNFPFIALANTREVRLPRKNMTADGAESTYDAWIRILPEDAYTIKDPSSGRLVSSLTQDDVNLLHSVYAVWEELFKELDVRTNAMDPVLGNLVRRKNYTIFHGYCTNHWSNGDSREPAKSNFPALFIVTAKGFIDLVRNSIEDTNLMAGRDNWTDEIYNRETSGRSGIFLFSVSKADGPGFNISINHNLNAQSYLSGVNIKDEDAELMENPIENFLGWQANKDEEKPSDQRKLFNARLMKESLDFMTMQLAKIRAAKNSNTDIREAIKATNEAILKAQDPTNKMGQTTNDPILSQMASAAVQMDMNVVSEVEVDKISEKNNDPFATPPAGHMDPMSGNPVSFSGFGGSDNGLPF